MTFQAPDFPSKWEKQGFTVFKVQGHGEKKDYYRACDTVIRNSRLFKYLMKKVLQKNIMAVSQAHFRAMWKERYMAQHKELQDFVKFSNKTIGAYEKKIAKLQQELAQAKLSRDRKKNIIDTERHRKRKLVENKRIAEKDGSLYNNHLRFFTQPLFATQAYKRPAVRAEYFLRAIITLKEHNDSGELNYNEFLILATGTHLKAFNKNDLVNRFGDEVQNWFTRTNGKMIEKGYVMRFERKDLYYLTDEGKAKLKNVLRLAVTRKMNTYWGDIFDETKITKRKLPT